MDADTVSHDALASINTRADKITSSMGKATKLQADHEELQLATTATENALDAIDEKRRSKRAAEEAVDARLKALEEKEKKLNAMTDRVDKMVGRVRNTMSKLRSRITVMPVGVKFKQTSNLELQTPPTINELALMTKVSFYFNIASSDPKAFLLYLGNIQGTHTKMPMSSTDDFLALEVVDSGQCKLTIDLGAGEQYIFSKNPITYDQWNKLEIMRNGYEVTMTVSSEAGPGEITQDVVTDLLPRIDGYGRPFGSVFNLHPEYSRIFVGGFPSEMKIQSSVRETFMVGSMEGLVIGDQPLGLFNFKKANDISGAQGRNKFRTAPDKGVRFLGSSYLALDRTNYAEMDTELFIQIKFKFENPNGLLFLAGKASDGDFLSLELKGGSLVYSFNLGDGKVSVESESSYEPDTWITVQLSRDNQYGTMSINGEPVGSVDSTGEHAQLSMDGDLYLGGYPGPIPFEIRSSNFTGCIEEVKLGPDNADLRNANEAINTKTGCSVKVNYSEI